MKTVPGTRLRNFVTTGALLALLLALPVIAGAANRSVTCRYLQADGRHIQLQLTIGSPAPATIIVIQYLPPGTAIEQAQPAFSRFNQNSGEAKWLLKGVGAGRLLIDLHLSQPVQAGTVHGEIRYKHPTTGAMITEKIAP
jgi:hypothetical protein